MSPRKERKDAKMYEYNGQRMSLKRWAEVLGVDLRTMQRRIAEGRPESEIFSQDRRVGDNPRKYLRGYFRKLEREAEERQYGEDTDI